jgi:EAL and modified HD-GYP domain-containing signal transduction protein
MTSLSDPPPTLPDLRTGTGAAIFVSRQPVLDAQRRVTGYRIAYATSGARDADRLGFGVEGSATRLFGDIVSVVGLGEVSEGALAHLPVSKRLLFALGVPPVRPDQVVLRVSHANATDPDLADVLASLAGRGYAMSLFDLPSLEIAPSLLETFGIVELDPNAWPEAELRTAVAKLGAARASALAVELGDARAFERARELGFDLFAGPFFAAPRATEVRHVPVGSLSTLAAVARMQGAGASIDELEAIVDRDIGLSVKLLRYINSAYFGMRSRVTSMRQAVMMLGARGVSRWAMMVALTGGTAAPTELSLIALTRARMCELLAEQRGDVAPDKMFTIGLLSLADALLDAPLERVVAELPLADEVVDALLLREGPAGAILDAVTSYEIGRFGAQSVLEHGDGAGAAYLEALRWAQDTVREVS